MPTTNTSREVTSTQGTGQTTVNTPEEGARRSEDGPRTITRTEAVPEVVSTRTNATPQNTVTTNRTSTTPETTVVSTSSRPQVISTRSQSQGGHYAILVKARIPFSSKEPRVS